MTKQTHYAIAKRGQNIFSRDLNKSISSSHSMIMSHSGAVLYQLKYKAKLGEGQFITTKSEQKQLYCERDYSNDLVKRSSPLCTYHMNNVNKFKPKGNVNHMWMIQDWQDVRSICWFIKQFLMKTHFIGFKHALISCRPVNFFRSLFRSKPFFKHRIDCSFKNAKRQKSKKRSNTRTQG